MNPTHRFARHLALGLVAGLALSAWSATVDQAAADTGCATPVLQALIDPAASTALSPSIVLHARDLALPAQGRFDWGDGRFGVASIGKAGGGDPQVLIQPDYADPGRYRLALEVTDACGETTAVNLTVRVPLSLPPAATVGCPGVVDVDGLCVVAPDMEHQFSLDPSIGGIGRWQWTAPAEGVADGPRSETLRLRLEANQAALLQAGRPSDDGWLVTPALHVVAVPSQRAAISDYVDPRTVGAGEPVELGFRMPPGGDAARASIQLDGEEVAAAASAIVELDAGTHDVVYRLAYPDGQVVQRQIVVVARDAGPPLLLLALAVTGAAGMVVAGLLGLRRRRRRAAKRRQRALADRLGEPPPWPEADRLTVASHTPRVAGTDPRSNPLPAAAHACQGGCICTQMEAMYG